MSKPHCQPTCPCHLRQRVFRHSEAERSLCLQGDNACDNSNQSWRYSFFAIRQIILKLDIHHIAPRTIRCVMSKDFNEKLYLKCILYLSNKCVPNKFVPNKLLKLITGVNIAHFNANLLYFVKFSILFCSGLCEI